MPDTTPDDGKGITPERAKEIIDAFQKSPEYFKGIEGGFYGKNVLLKMLTLPGCKGLRYYHALVPNKDTNIPEQTIVLVVEDLNGAIMTGTYTDEGPLCPPFCG